MQTKREMSTDMSLMSSQVADLRLKWRAIAAFMKPETLLFAAMGMLVAGNITSTTLNFGLFGAFVALLGIVALVAGLVLMGDPTRDDFE